MMGKAGFLLGIDAGTSRCKAAVFDDEGNQIATASRHTPLQRPHPGWSELDPDNAWNAAVTVIREAVENAGVDPTTIRAVGISAAMVGAWVLDANGTPLRPGIVWEDSRSQPILDAMQEQDPAIMSRIFASSGSVMQQGCTLPLLAWLKRHEPDLIGKAAHVVSYKDFLRFQLTGLMATDRSEASVIPGDARTRSRSDEMIALFGLADCAHLLPLIHDSEEIIGGLTPQAAQLTGLAEGTPVAVGAGDVVSTVIGAGGVDTGVATAVLGTTCLVGVCHDRPVFEPRDLGLLFSMPGDLWYRAMVNVAGTLNLDWAIGVLAPDLQGRDDCYQQVTALVDAVAIGANGVSYLPYLSESGIIAPVVAPHARAQFSGLSPAHGRAHMLRAVYEGVAFALYDLVSALGFDDGCIKLTGGGSQSPLWCQMIADMLQKEVIVPAGTEFGARGAALIAATALGDFADIRAASMSATGEDCRYLPSAAVADDYRHAYALYAARRDALISGK
ncbi:FGGY-family carbohydrate kinase [Hoeflea sp. Naph1]|uniref:FGGY-family carbohydrate kinase n=1 Tax=Hoeflea sp. Naph1 TaxID=3388653 RepID=UPI00398FA3D4